MSDAVLYIVGGLLFLAWEAWLGKTPRLKAGSTLELAWNFCHGVYKILVGNARRVEQTGGARMTIIDKTIRVSQPVDHAFTALEELIADLIEGRPSAELQGDAIAIFSLFSEVGQIKPDYAADAEAVERTVVLGGEHLVRRVLKAMQAKGALTPGR